MREHCLIGGVQNQKWVRADRFLKSLKSSGGFELYTLKGAVGTDLSTAIGDDVIVPNGTDLREGSVAEYLHENDAPDTKTIVVCSLSELRCRTRAPL
jgi:hypothetical protein